MVRAAGWLVGNELKEGKYNLMKGASCGGKRKTVGQEHGNRNGALLISLKSRILRAKC